LDIPLPASLSASTEAARRLFFLKFHLAPH